MQLDMVMYRCMVLQIKNCKENERVVFILVLCK